MKNNLDLIEMHLIERDWVEVFVVDVDESVVFAVSHQIADVYDQFRRSVIPN